MTYSTSWLPAFVMLACVVTQFSVYTICITPRDTLSLGWIKTNSKSFLSVAIEVVYFGPSSFMYRITTSSATRFTTASFLLHTWPSTIPSLACVFSKNLPFLLKNIIIFIWVSAYPLQIFPYRFHAKTTFALIILFQLSATFDICKVLNIISILCQTSFLTCPN